MKNTFKSAINDAKNTTKLVLYISIIYEPRAGPKTILAPNVPVIYKKRKRKIKVNI